MKRSTILFAALAIVFGFVLFKVKYEVVDIERNLKSTLCQIEKEKGNIHVLKAEWSHLNEPERLQKLAEKYLDSAPAKTEQILAITSSFGRGDAEDGRLRPGAQLASMKARR